MALRQETLEFIRALEVSANRKLHYPEVVGILVESVRVDKLRASVDELVFLAKFLTKSFGVMKRIGVDGEGYEKLSLEFKSNLEKVIALLRQCHEEGVGAAGPEQLSRFFSMTPQSLDDLMLLLSDLTLVKNWSLDGKKMPWREN